ncbi:MAG: hypothetical protein M1834_003802 [Cirrosporium novae-zelandiae]|nr:MAG: hypothetical protein M1834_003802 [Cirrosporium novae-zelandiae]
MRSKTSPRHEPSLKRAEAPPEDDATPLATMVQLEAALRTSSRPPPIEDVAKAFVSYTSARKHPGKGGNVLLENEANYLLTTCRYLLDSKSEGEEPHLSVPQVKDGLTVLFHAKADPHATSRVTLATVLFTEIRQRVLADKDIQPPPHAYKGAFNSYIFILSRSGATEFARQLLMKEWSKTPDPLGVLGYGLWLDILRGFRAEENRDQMAETIKIMKDLGVPFMPVHHAEVVTYFTWRDDVESARKWYEYPIANGEPPSKMAIRHVLLLCIRQKQWEWGNQVLDLLLQRSSEDKFASDSVLSFAAGQGKSVDDIEKMMDAIYKREGGKNKSNIDIDTINKLIGIAVMRKDPYQAERFLALGYKRNIEPNAVTYVYQIEYRLLANDVEGARNAYVGLQSQDQSILEEYETINHLIRALCTAETTKYDDLMSIVDDLQSHPSAMEPETLASLTLFFLRREEFSDIETLFQSHFHQLAPSQRVPIETAILDFCFDRRIENHRAWDAYTLLITAFPSTPEPIRRKLMVEFFNRSRPDMGCHVFGHMRQQQDLVIRPTAETYILCLEGIAEAADLEGLDLIHNMLKLDIEVEPCTRLSNALMLAYAACAMPYRSIEFWEDIINSTEGPTYGSIEIVLHACESVPHGDRYAKGIWERLQALDISVDKRLYVAYICALAGQCEDEEVLQLLSKMEVEVENGDVDAWTLGSILNATPGQNRKDDLEARFSELYPSAFRDLQTRFGCIDISPEEAAEIDEDQENWEEGGRESVRMVSEINGMEGTRTWKVDRGLRA